MKYTEISKNKKMGNDKIEMTLNFDLLALLIVCLKIIDEEKHIDKGGGLLNKCNLNGQLIH